MRANEQVIIVTLTSVIAPLVVLFLGNWVRSKLNHLNSIPTLLAAQARQESRLLEVKIEIKKITELEKSHILIEQQVQTQWKRLDELREDIKEKQV